ncbi:MAG: sugar nucleotide-binding protein [Sphingomonas sp.]|nr:sugar nucleotide-binding protein [Sphingomonas sp.]
MPNRTRLLVTGGKGMLGSALFEEASLLSDFDARAPGRDELDVRDAEAVNRWAGWIEGGWIIHCAARVDVEGCAREPEAARETIVDGTRHVADLAVRSGARLLYPQSFLTYDGHPNPIPEDEPLRPLSFYGELKRDAEQVVTERLPDALIVRMAGFFGGAAADKNFVGRIIPAMFAAIGRGDTRFEVGDRIWQPTWTRDLAANSLHLIAKNASGSYQMACIGHATFAELAQEIGLALGWTGHLEIVSVDASRVSQNELGRRPDAAVLSCARLDAEHANLQRPWRDTLHAYLADPFFDQYRLEPTA